MTDGLKNSGYTLDQELLQVYTNYMEDAKSKRPKALPFMPEVPIAEMTVTPALAGKLASEADVALITVGRNSGILTCPGLRKI